MSEQSYPYQKRNDGWRLPIEETCNIDLSPSHSFSFPILHPTQSFIRTTSYSMFRVKDDSQIKRSLVSSTHVWYIVPYRTLLSVQTVPSAPTSKNFHGLNEERMCYKLKVQMKQRWQVKGRRRNRQISIRTQKCFDTHDEGKDGSDGSRE